MLIVAATGDAGGGIDLFLIVSGVTIYGILDGARHRWCNWLQSFRLSVTYKLLFKI